MDYVTLPHGTVLLSDVVEYHLHALSLRKLSLHGAPNMRPIFIRLLENWTDGLSQPEELDEGTVRAAANDFHLITEKGFFRSEAQAYARAILYRDENKVLQYFHLYGQIANFNFVKPYMYREVQSQMKPGMPFGMSDDMRITCESCSIQSPDRLLRLAIEVIHGPMNAPFQVKNFARLRLGEATFIDRPIT